MSTPFGKSSSPPANVGAASLFGWRLWLRGGWAWKIAVVALLALHVSFLPWPRRLYLWLGHPAPRHWLTPWAPVAWDSQLFADRLGADYFAIYEAGYRTLRGMDPYTV